MTNHMNHTRLRLPGSLAKELHEVFRSLADQPVPLRVGMFLGALWAWQTNGEAQRPKEVSPIPQPPVKGSA